MQSRLALRDTLAKRLKKYEKANGVLPGVRSEAARVTFLEQLVDSVRRVEYVKVIRDRDVSEARASPDSEGFDPLMAAIYRMRQGDLDDACWLVFLSIHSGKHRTEGWRLTRNLYAGEGSGGPWTWDRVSQDVAGFRAWLGTQVEVWRANGAAGRFGNHRRYESLSGSSPNGTGAVVESYTNWIRSYGGHTELLIQANMAAPDNPGSGFSYLYKSMVKVHRFGRLSRFDFLCMLAKLGIAKIEPATPYLASSSGPLKGARLMAGQKETAVLDAQMAELGRVLQVNMQVIEDALCNWQKRNTSYVRFRG
jgi:hypothetical protein